jgi:hypothetical protein
MPRVIRLIGWGSACRARALPPRATSAKPGCEAVSSRRRGALALRLPVGSRRLADGPAILAPDVAVRHTLERLFPQCQTRKNARAVQRYVLQHQRPMPRLVPPGPEASRIVWAFPTNQMVPHVLTRPVSAGGVVDGRRPLVPTPGDPPRRPAPRRPLDAWESVGPDVSPASIPYAQSLANRRALRAPRSNFAPPGRGAARAGCALWQRTAPDGQ